jgi:PAS domain S-box-containing protein
MSKDLPGRPEADHEPWFWRAIPLRQPPWTHAVVVTALVLALALGLRLAVIGFPAGMGPSSTFFPAFIVATLFAGPRWGWGSWAATMALSLFAPWNPAFDIPQQGTVALFGLSGAVTVMAASGLRTALVRLRREAAARGEAEAMLKLAEEAGGLGLWDWDLRVGRARWSPGVFHNLGATPRPDAPDYGELLAYVHPDDVDRLRAANTAVIRDGRFYQIDYRAIGDDGQERWIHARGQVHRDADGKAVRIVGYNLDVTARYRAAEQLRESEARFRNLADSAPALLWLSLPGGAREFVNSAYVAFLGGDDEAALTADWRTRLHPDDLNRILKEQVAGETSRKPFSLEARYRRADGEWRWLKSFSQPRISAGGAFTGFGGIAFDVTDAKQVEADLQHINELLEDRVQTAMAERDQAHAALMQSQKLEALGQLTGGVAHDFNNLLTVIIGALDIVQRHPEDTVRTTRLGKAALDAAQRGERLTRQLLAFSRRQPLRPEITSIDGLIRDSEALYRGALGERFTLDLVLEAGEARVSIDPAQFDAALMNLLVNARDAMTAGGLVVIVTAVEHRTSQGDVSAGDYISVTVRDTGEGMDEATRARIFEPFFSTKPVGKGTGLGLSQVYGFVRQSGGSVTVDSAPGQGAAITLLIPLTRAAVVAAGGDAAPVRRPMAPLDVLLVEDDPAVATLAEAMLRELGHEVTLAIHPTDALAQLEGPSRFTLLLTDVVMPGDMTGVDLARQVVAARPDLPVLLSSGYTGQILDSAEDAPWPLLRKPYTLDALAAAIAAAVEGA